MKILVITPFFPYSTVRHAGGKFTCRIIKALSQRHEIHLMSRIEPDQLGFAGEMKKICSRIELLTFKTPKKTDIVSLLRIIASYLLLGLKANRLIRNEAFDLVHVEHVETSLLVKRIRGLPMVLIAHDVITKPARRRFLSAHGLEKCVSYLRWKVTVGVERYIVRKFDKVFTMSQYDKDLLLSLDNNLDVSVVGYPISDTAHTPEVDKEPHTLVFAGAMQRDVNVETVTHFCEKILPLIKKSVPEVRFYVVGNNPPESVTLLAKDNPDIIVTGFVNDLRPYYLKSTVFVSPLLIGGGIIVKNLEAMAMGLPVVTTTIGNEGIEAVPDRDIMVADNPDEFAKKVVVLLKNRQGREEIARNGKAFVVKNFSLDSVIDTIEESYNELVRRRAKVNPEGS